MLNTHVRRVFLADERTNKHKTTRGTGLSGPVMNRSCDLGVTCVTSTCPVDSL